ncbi:MAG: YegS/Rv2252/BmrU family lipid kinase [Myxococcota bacterium]|nr:YegS/Rv2252/BmrU family lipid kinase [Myxococcota bacterium]
MSYFTYVIVNPASQSGATGRYWPELQRALNKVLTKWDFAFTKAPGDATRLSKQAVMDGYEMIVSVGGDGTMNEVVNGLFESEKDGSNPRLVKDDIIIGAVRSGTGGDFARLFDLPGTIPGSVAHLAGEKTQPCDLGWVEFVDHRGQPKGQAFLNIASFGLSGVVADKINKGSKALGGRISFYINTLRALASYRRQHVRVSVDDEVFVDEPLVTVAIANGQYFGGGMHMAPNAKIDDGEFDVVTQIRAGMKEVLKTSDLYAGRAIHWQSVRSSRGKMIQAIPFRDEANVLLDIDGEQPGRLPARFSNFHKAIRLKL